MTKTVLLPDGRVTYSTMMFLLDQTISDFPRVSRGLHTGATLVGAETWLSSVQGGDAGELQFSHPGDRQKPRGRQ